jgi:predicted lipid carrier protein YhbT
VNRPLMDPEQYAALVRETPDDQLEAGVTANRDLILAEIFKAMPARFLPDRGSDRLVAEWRIKRDADEGHNAWQVRVGDGQCEVVPGGHAQPDVTLTIGPVDFVKLVAGVVTGPALFMAGRLEIGGDLAAAARMDAMFRTPGQQAG